MYVAASEIASFQSITITINIRDEVEEQGIYKWTNDCTLNSSDQVCIETLKRKLREVMYPIRLSHGRKLQGK